MPAPLKPLTNSVLTNSVLGDLAVPHKSENCYIPRGKFLNHELIGNSCLIINLNC